MIRYALRRLLLAVGQLAALAVVVFGLTALLPGDAAEVAFNEQSTPGQVRALREQLGLDQPLPVRFAHWAGDLLTGDLGTSLTGHRPVAGIVTGSLPTTLTLAVVTVALLVPLALVVGLVTGLRAGGRLDRTVSAVTLALGSVPDFVLALALVALFSLRLGWLPATWLGTYGGGGTGGGGTGAGMGAGMGAGTGASAGAGGGGLGELPYGPALFVLPVAVLLARTVGLLSRQIRAGTVTALRSGYVTQARRLGVPRRALLLRHVLPNAAVPGVQELARTSDHLLGGVLVVEAVFAIPGTATALVEAVTTRDVPTVQALTLLLAAVTLLAGLAADLACLRLAPRTEMLR